MLKSLGLPYHENMLQMDLLGVGNWRQRVRRGRLRPGAHAFHRQHRSEQAESKDQETSSSAQGISFELNPDRGITFAACELAISIVPGTPWGEAHFVSARQSKLRPVKVYRALLIHANVFIEAQFDGQTHESTFAS